MMFIVEDISQCEKKHKNPLKTYTNYKEIQKIQTRNMMNNDNKLNLEITKQIL